jgi:hypothetical protein
MPRDDILAFFQARQRMEQKRTFSKWRKSLLSVPPDYKYVLRDGLQADIELQPWRWLNSGLTILESPKVIASVQLPGNITGPPMSSYLHYVTFQAGAELFLKGLWLCQFEECRSQHSKSYIAPSVRQGYKRKLVELGHDLLEIVEAVRNVPRFRKNRPTSQFLRAVEAIIRIHYFPLYEADNRGSQWAKHRYPKRFYDDASRKSFADEWHKYPEQALVARLFRDMAERADRLWSLRQSLAKKLNE